MAEKVPTNWEKVSEELDLQVMGVEGFISFDDGVAVCGEFTETDILDSVLAETVAHQEEEEEEIESDRPVKESLKKDSFHCLFLKKLL